MRTDAVVAILLLIFAVALGVSYLVVRERENSCAAHCREAGFAGYEYKGFGGGGRHLVADSCKCSNVGSFPPADRS